MPLEAPPCLAQLQGTHNAAAMLDASCQALMQARIQPVASPWFTTLNQELSSAQALASNWRGNGMATQKTCILDTVTQCGTRFLQMQPDIESLFTQLEQSYNMATQMRLSAALATLQAPTQALVTQAQAYAARLAAFEQQMLSAQTQMQQTVSEVQAQEASIQSEISTINAAIARMQQQVEQDRQAIAQARSQETRGIVETIFGVLLAPLTGGASLILAGIGVASLAEAEEALAQLQDNINAAQQGIVQDQSQLSDDQRAVATLQGLTMSAGLVLSDLNQVTQALDALRITWVMFNGELSAVIQRLQQAQSGPSIVVDHAWFRAACAAWALIAQQAPQLCQVCVPSGRAMRVG